MFWELWPKIKAAIPEPEYRADFARGQLRLFLDLDVDPNDLQGVDPEIDQLMDEVNPPIPDSLDWTCFSPNRATKWADGSITVPAGGQAEGSGIWDGFLEIRPDHADYQFWLWLLRRWPYHSQLSSEDIPTLKDEYAKGVA